MLLFSIGNGAGIRPLEMGRKSPAHCWKSHVAAQLYLLQSFYTLAWTTLEADGKNLKEDTNILAVAG